jgi:glycosyltransferase involved in cell wall biosynthesis
MIGLLRVRNEARWIQRCIASIQPICWKIIVMDDHSTDGTRELCAAMPGVEVFESPYDGLNETRDKNLLLDKARLAEWVILIDGDEMLAPGADKIIWDATSGNADCLSPRILYLWDTEDQVRVDGVYGRFRRPSVFRPGQHQFEPTSAGGNFHCSNAPRALHGQSQPIEAAFLHFGYLHREDRIRKYRWYNQQDPGNRNEDMYRHVVQGDLPEVPMSARLMHAGPLWLEPLMSPAVVTA